jgi:type II secretory pathway component PulF
MLVQFQARTRAGELTRGEVEAPTLRDARRQLIEQGLFIVNLATPGAHSRKLAPALRTARSGVKKDDLMQAFSQLTIMCQSGVDLAEALHNLATRCAKPALREVLQKVDSDVSSGQSLSDALRKHPRVFDDTIVAGIAAGEQSGNITHVLERITYLIRSDIRLRSAIWSMLMYPMVLALVTCAVILAMMFFVLPQFATVFESLERPVPPLTQLLLDTGALVRSHWVLFLVGAIGSIVSIHMGLGSQKIYRMRDHLTLHLVLIRNASRSLMTGRAFRLLGTMLTSGIPLVEALRLCRQSSASRLFQDMWSVAERDVLNGDGLGKALLASTFLPDGAAQMVATAERSGKMGEVLSNVGEFYEDQGQQHLRDLVKVAEPVVIVLLGVVVGGIVLSIMLPILDVSTAS